MKLEHDDDNLDPHPEDGWITAPTLVDTEITSLTLCRFTGRKVKLDTVCVARDLGLHKDVDCASLYLQAEALASGTVDQTLFPEVQEEIRTPAAGDDVTGQLP